MELKQSTDEPVRQQGEKQDSAHVFTKLSSTGITLIPQPSDDVKDPLVCFGISVSDVDRSAGLHATYTF